MGESQVVNYDREKIPGRFINIGFKSATRGSVTGRRGKLLRFDRRGDLGGKYLQEGGFLMRGGG